MAIVLALVARVAAVALVAQVAIAAWVYSCSSTGS